MAANLSPPAPDGTILLLNQVIAAAAQIRADAEPDWVGMAYDLGYSSQQHFITDFRTVLDATPVQYKKGLPPDRCVSPASPWSRIGAVGANSLLAVWPYA